MKNRLEEIRKKHGINQEEVAVFWRYQDKLLDLLKMVDIIHPLL
jgi:hypothetical protein